jgi:hypothetical protein
MVEAAQTAHFAEFPDTYARAREATIARAPSRRATRKVPEAFSTWNIGRYAQGHLLRAAVDRIDSELSRVSDGLPRASEVRRRLDPQRLSRADLPTLRMVQIHLRAIRIRRFGQSAYSLLRSLRLSGGL